MDYRYTYLIPSRPIHIRSVRQNNTISPKLCIQALEEVIQQLDWEEKGPKISLTIFRYANDIAQMRKKN